MLAGVIMKQQADLRGLRVLIVEDLFLVADELADVLAEWGCEVLGPAACVESALALVEENALDAALLDVNLGGDERSFPIAQALGERDVPFVFLSGYDMISIFPLEFRETVRLSKPVQPRVLKQVLAEIGRHENVRPEV
jgi:DNA-binding NarL/FixJ family response regulator